MNIAKINKRLNSRISCHMRRRDLDEQRIKTNLKVVHINRSRAAHTKTGRALSPWQFLPYTVDDLREHLEALFEPGMTWEQMERWHIDHIKPVRLFHFTHFDDPDFLECFALENLRPMWASDNSRKGGKWVDPDLCPNLPGFDEEKDRIGGQLNAS